MTVFDKIVEKENEGYRTLGNPLGEFNLGRMIFFKLAMNGKGWPQAKKPLKRDSMGLTRGERKRILRAIANAKVSEDRAPEFRHKRFTRENFPERFA